MQVLRRKDTDVPHILMGASSSSRIGWLMKISRAVVHKYRISDSKSCTGFPGLFPLTDFRVGKGVKKDMLGKH